MASPKEEEEGGQGPIPPPSTLEPASGIPIGTQSSTSLSVGLGQRISFSEVDNLNKNLEEHEIILEPDVCDWKMKNGNVCGRPVKKNGKCSLHLRLAGKKRDSTSGRQEDGDPNSEDATKKKKKNPLERTSLSASSPSRPDSSHCICVLKNGKICGKPVKLNNRCGIHGKTCIADDATRVSTSESGSLSSASLLTESHAGRCPCVLKSGQVCNKILKDGKTRCSRHQAKKCVPFTEVTLPPPSQENYLPLPKSFDPDFNPTEMDLTLPPEISEISEDLGGSGVDALTLLSPATPVAVEGLEDLTFEDFQEEDEEGVQGDIVEQEEKTILLVEEEDDEMGVLEGDVAWKEYQVTEEEMLRILKETMITDISTKQLEFLESEIQNCFF